MVIEVLEMTNTTTCGGFESHNHRRTYFLASLFFMSDGALGGGLAMELWVGLAQLLFSH